MPLTIEITASSSKLKVQCRIFSTKREMLRGIRKDVIGGIENSTMACCVHATKSTIDRNDLAAIIFFSKTHLDRGTVSHEFVHAAHNIQERRKGRKDREEDLATLTGELVNAFYKKQPTL